MRGLVEPDHKLWFIIGLLLADFHRFLLSSEGLPVNRYGYSPMALEWDLWLDPSNPSGLAGANVDHGSPLHLVQQVGSGGSGRYFSYNESYAPHGKC